MNCPKCGGEAYLVEEELVQVLENVDPPKIIAKAIYQCRACGERFSRLVTEDLDAKKKEEGQAPSVFPPGGGTSSRVAEEPEGIDKLKFF